MKEIETLAKAKVAGEAAALAIWERDEKQDRGSCGGAMLELDARSRLYKAIKASNIVKLMDGFVILSAPEGVRSQNMDIPEAQYRAFKKTIEEAGFGKAIKRFWTYVD